MDPDTFQNDMTSIRVKDDVLTLLVHLGYLAYDEVSGTVRIPNAEVRAEVARSIAKSRHPKLVELMRASTQLVDDVLNLREGNSPRGLRMCTTATARRCSTTTSRRCARW